MKWTDNGGGDFEQPPVGTHVGRCIRIIDIGTQKGEYQGKVNIRRQVIIAWELPTELMTEGDYSGKPFTTSRFYTASLNEKATLRHDLESWRGRAFSPQELMGFDSKNILGKPCMLNLLTNDKGRVKMGGVMALPKGIEVPAQVNPSIFFSLEPDEFSKEVFDKLSDGYKKLIQSSPEYQEAINPRASKTGSAALRDMEDDIPFVTASLGNDVIYRKLRWGHE